VQIGGSDQCIKDIFCQAQRVEKLETSKKSAMIRIVTPCRAVEVQRNFGGTFRVNIQEPNLILDVCSLAHSPNLMMEAIHLSETLMDFYRTATPS
jgi:hypothetical protein